MKNSSKPQAFKPMSISYVARACVIALMMLALASQLTAQVPMIRLGMSGPNNSQDETVLYYQQGATAGFDSNYDAYKLFGPNPSAHISQTYAGTLMQINGIEPVADTVFSISILTTTNTTGNYTISATDFYFVPTATCIKLHDLFTGTITDIKTVSYTFNLADTTSVPRFLLNISLATLPVTTQLFQPACGNVNSGQFIAEGIGAGPFNYAWKDSSGNLLKNSSNKFSSDTLSGLGFGYYKAEVQTVGGCDFFGTDFTIYPPITPVADFIAADTVLLSAGGQWQAMNISANAVGYEWNFGDSSTAATAAYDLNPDHFYTLAGNYVVTLTAISSTFCTDTFSKTIVVAESITTGLAEQAEENIKWCTLAKNQFALQQKENEPISIEIFDAQGRIVLNEKSSAVVTNLNTDHFIAGIYTVKACSKNCFKAIRFVVE
ncbi:MAG: PKD domain-containing protein [Bacteroidia bacterium]|nr:PKD domain-containing protein [Bacteroidia bacterium]